MKIQVYPNGLYYFPVNSNKGPFASLTQDEIALEKATRSCSSFYQTDFETVKAALESNGHILEIVSNPKEEIRNNN